MPGAGAAAAAPERPEAAPAFRNTELRTKTKQQQQPASPGHQGSTRTPHLPGINGGRAGLLLQRATGGSAARRALSTTHQLTSLLPAAFSKLIEGRTKLLQAQHSTDLVTIPRISISQPYKLPCLCTQVGQGLSQVRLFPIPSLTKQMRADNMVFKTAGARNQERLQG